MALKTTIAAGLAALTMSLFAGASAEAGTKVVVGVGTPGWGVHSCWGWPRRCGWGPRPYYGYRYVAPRPVVIYKPAPVRRTISCNAARNIVDGSGYNRVVARNCSGYIYKFNARRNGQLYRVTVNARNGAIIGSHRI